MVLVDLHPPQSQPLRRCPLSRGVQEDFQTQQAHIHSSQLNHTLGKSDDHLLGAIQADTGNNEGKRFSDVQ